MENTHYYLVNGKLMKGTKEMPKKAVKSGNVNLDETNNSWYNIYYNEWEQSLQPCDIEQSELAKMHNYLLPNNAEIDGKFQYPIDVTELVEEKEQRFETKSGSWTDYIYKFKAPKQIDSCPTCGNKVEIVGDTTKYFKQIDSEENEDVEIHNHKDWDLAYHFYRLGRFEEREGMFQNHFKEYLTIKSE